MTKIKKIVSLSMILVLTICIVSITNSQNVSAKMRNGYYCTTFTQSPHIRYEIVRKIQFKGNKVKIWGTFKWAKKEDNAYSNGKYLNYKKRTFKLTKKTKYCGRAMFKDIPESKKEFVKRCKENCKYSSGLGLLIRVKNGKVVKMVITP